MPEKTQKNQQQGAKPLQDQSEEKLKFSETEDLIEDEEAKERMSASTNADNTTVR